jgi:DNA-binding GntR family transcriptional regulator
MMNSINRTVKDALVENLRDEIIKGQFRPGQKLRQEELAAHFGVSTMPIREALRELEAEGLVTIKPRRGAVVTRLSAEDLQDIYDIRSTLEEMATRLAVPCLNEASLAALAQCVQQMDSHVGDPISYTKLNHQFHLTIYAASGRRHLCELIELLRRRTQHYVHTHIGDMGRMPESRHDHRAILDACQRGDADRAATIMREHLGRVGQELVEYFELHEEDD